VMEVADMYVILVATYVSRGRLRTKCRAEYLDVKKEEVLGRPRKLGNELHNSLLFI
jgi:hypothetical protein